MSCLGNLWHRPPQHVCKCLRLQDGRRPRRRQVALRMPRPAAPYSAAHGQALPPSAVARAAAEVNICIRLACCRHQHSTVRHTSARMRLQNVCWSVMAATRGQRAALCSSTVAALSVHVITAAERSPVIGCQWRSNRDSSTSRSSGGRFSRVARYGLPLHMLPFASYCALIWRAPRGFSPEAADGRTYQTAGICGQPNVISVLRARGLLQVTCTHSRVLPWAGGAQTLCEHNCLVLRTSRVNSYPLARPSCNTQG